MYSNIALTISDSTGGGEQFSIIGAVVLALVEQVLDQAFGQGKFLIILRVKDNLFLIGTSKNLDFPENVNVISRVSVSQDPPKGN